MDSFVNATSIRKWAEKLDARGTLPQIIRRLVLGTVTDILAIDFPAFESIQRPGFDGTIECARGNTWVPNGRSVWELSTDKDARGKAEDDFSKRTEQMPREDQEKSIYVCVNPRRFNDKAIWAQEKAKITSWRAVRAYDADDLEQWVESAPAGVAAWFGRQIGSRPVGVDDVAEYWTGVSKAASCELLPTVFLSGREQSIERIRNWLAGKPSRLGIDCRSPEEVVDFFCAAVAAMSEQERLAAESRAVIVNASAAWEALRDASTGSVLVVHPSLSVSEEEVARAVANGHHVLVATEANILGERSGSQLERAGAFELARALEDSGYPYVKAEKFARAAGGSLAILKHRLAPARRKPVPQWASDASPEIVAACLLLGGWGSNDADCRAFAQIAGRAYTECEAELQRMANSLEPLLVHAAGKWRLVSKDHAWLLFEDRVAPLALQKFEALAVDILADDDPRYRLAADERFYASIRGHVPQYSETIKRHVAETLAFLGAFGGKLEAASTISIEAAVDRIVTSVLPAASTWHRWASLGSRLPLIAEASPSSFLRAVREDIQRAQPELVNLLHEDEDSFFGRCNHAGLLWALEGLAWAKEYLGEVARILLALAVQDTGQRRWANRPESSLRKILSYWLPHTTAAVDERVQILEMLIRANRDAVWPLLFRLLPESVGETSVPTHVPYWRDWADNWQRGATRADSMIFVTATAERIIDEAGGDPIRWKDIFAQVGRLPYTVRERLLAAADAFSMRDVPDDERRLLSEELSRQITRHRNFQNAHWSLPSEMLSDLEKILERLKPKSPVLRNAWLFEQWPDRFLEGTGDYSDSLAALETARRKAIHEILDSEGIEGIDSLVEHTKSPYDVGRALAMTTDDMYLQHLVPRCLEGNQHHLEFAAGFVCSRFGADNWKWVDDKLQMCTSANARANLLIFLQFSPEVWDRAAAAGTDTCDLYWARCRAFNPHLDSVAISRAVQNLCQYNRPVAAIDLLWLAIATKDDLRSDTLIAPLEALLTLSADGAESQLSQADGRHIEQIIGALQRGGDVDETRLAQIEWAFIRLLGPHSENAPRTLQRHLSASPEFFNEILNLCYRSSHDRDAPPEAEPSVDQRQRAERAYHLLHDWDRIPGTRDDETIDEGELREWCNKAREMADASGRLGVCDTHIGELFAKSKQLDNDGAWPCVAIRRVASEIATDDLENGMCCGIHNLRGVQFRGSRGDQERALAEKFRERARRARVDFPFIARVLDSVVKSYETEAKWWDDQDRWEE